MRTILRGALCLTPEGWGHVDVTIRDQHIESIGQAVDGPIDRDVDAVGSRLVPGLIDIHIHGADSALCESGDAEGLRRISSTLARFGVTGFLATIATLSPAALRKAVANVAGVAGSESGARILGIHLEGPYLNPQRAGAQSIAAMRAPSLSELDDLQALSGGRVRMVTLAPEVDGAIDFIRAAVERGIVVALGHSNATAAQMLAGIEAGGCHITHLFNAMRELHHREPGPIGVGLTDDRVSVELICDGHHLDARVIDIALRCKPRRKRILVSDAVALGVADGEHQMFGMPCIVADGAIRLAPGGNLAGSCLSLDRAVRNLHEWFPERPLEELIEAASTAPARLIAASDTGEIAVGKRADLVLLDNELRPTATFVGGRQVSTDEDQRET